MNPKQDFNNLYADVSGNIAAAMMEIEGLKVEHKDGKQELTNILGRLKVIQDRFDSELKTLEEHSEWEKFTITFFGETNAGKSTIIESLRILFNEDSRQKLLQKNSGDIEKYEKLIFSHAIEIREKLNSIYVDYVGEIREIKNSTTKLTEILQSESSIRIKQKMWMFAFGGGLVGAVVVAAMLQGR